MRDGTELRFVLTGGDAIIGKIEWYDRGSICVRQAEGPTVTLQKSAVR